MLPERWDTDGVPQTNVEDGQRDVESWGGLSIAEQIDRATANLGIADGWRDRAVRLEMPPFPRSTVAPVDAVGPPVAVGCRATVELDAARDAVRFATVALCRSRLCRDGFDTPEHTVAVWTRDALVEVAAISDELCWPLREYVRRPRPAARPALGAFLRRRPPAA